MILCQSIRGPASEGYWRWRIIDGRTCWYIGEARISKSQLVWGGTKPVGLTVEHKSVRSEKPNLTWGETKTREVVVARKSWSNDELEKLITTPVPPTEPPAPVVWDADVLNPLDQALIDSELTPQQRIDQGFEALGLRKGAHWIEPYFGPSLSSSASEGPAVAAVREDAAATVPLRDGIEIVLMFGVIVAALLLWRGIRVSFGMIGRAQ